MKYGCNIKKNPKPRSFTIPQKKKKVMTTIYKEQFRLLNTAFACTVPVPRHTWIMHGFWQRITADMISPEGCAWWLFPLMPKASLAEAAKPCPASAANQTCPAGTWKQDQGHQALPPLHPPAGCHRMAPPAVGFASPCQDSLFPLLSKALCVPLCASACTSVSVRLGKKDFSAQQKRQEAQLPLTYRKMLMPKTKYPMFSQ